MMPTNTAAKSTAKATLKGLWPQAMVLSFIIGLNAVLGYCIYSICYMLESAVVMVAAQTVYFLFITAPLYMGVLFWAWRVSQKSDSPVTEVFYFFSFKTEYIRVMSFIIIAALRLLLVAVVALLPYFMAHIVASPRLYIILGSPMPPWTAHIWVFESFLKYAGILGCVVTALRYYLAPLLFIMVQDTTPAESIYLAGQVSRVSSLSVISLFVSFLPWLISSILIIPAIFVLPYFVFSFTVHCRYAVNYYNNSLKQKNSFFSPAADNFGVEMKDDEK